MIDALAQIGIASLLIFAIILVWFLIYTLIAVARKQWRRDHPK